MKKHLVTLTEAERAALGQRVHSGLGPARELARARILLKADRGPHGPGWTDATIASALDVSCSTVERVRRRFAGAGWEAALRRQPPRREYRRKLDGEQEARLIALACSSPPLGRRFWTLRLLADKLVELRCVDGISPETVRRLLKKNALKPWLVERWVIPPERNGEFVWRMEDVLEVYTRPYDPVRPQVCMDEVSKQLLAHPVRLAYRSGAGQSGGLRVRAPWNRQPLPLLRAAPRLALRASDGQAHAARLGTVHQGLGRPTVSRGGEDRAGDGQPQYPHSRLSL